jgi:hypothetical protein
MIPQCHHMSHMDFVVSPPGCGRSVTDFWGWYAHEAQLRCPNEVGGGIWIWITRRGLNLNSTKLPRPWSPRGSSPSRKNPHGRTGNRTRDLMISSQKLWPLDHQAGRKGLRMHTHLFYVQYLALNNTDVLATPTSSLRLAVIYQAYAFGRIICVIIVCFSILVMCVLIFYLY